MPRLRHAEFLRIKIISDPSHEVAAFLVKGFGRRLDGLDQPLIAGDTTAVFRRPSPLAVDQPGNPAGVCGDVIVFYFDAVDPVVAKVIDVVKNLSGPGDPFRQPGPGRVLALCLLVGRFEASVVDVELVEMVVLPAEQHLDGPVQLVQGCVTRKDHGSPDGRLDALQVDSETQGGIAVLSGHCVWAHWVLSEAFPLGDVSAETFSQFPA
jgi:hypothetical protein